MNTAGAVGGLSVLVQAPHFHGHLSPYEEVRRDVAVRLELDVLSVDASLAQVLERNPLVGPVHLLLLAFPRLADVAASGSDSRDL